MDILLRKKAPVRIFLRQLKRIGHDHFRLCLLNTKSLYIYQTIKIIKPNQAKILRENFKRVYTHVLKTLGNPKSNANNPIKCLPAKESFSNSSSIFFAYQFHIDFLFYLILILYLQC